MSFIEVWLVVLHSFFPHKLIILLVTALKSVGFFGFFVLVLFRCYPDEFRGVFLFACSSPDNCFSAES